MEGRDDATGMADGAACWTPVAGNAAHKAATVASGAARPPPGCGT